MNVRKAVILAAGYGTRLLPASKAVPKEMLPLVDRPVIDYIVEEALAAGLDQIIMVTNASKTAIEGYFDRDFELESVLESGQKDALLAAVKRPAEVSIAYVHQKERLGNGHAVTITRDLVGNVEVLIAGSALALLALAAGLLPRETRMLERLERPALAPGTGAMGSSIPHRP